MALNGFQWNQAELGEAIELRNGLVTLLAFTPDRSPKLIGTGFIIGAYGNSAIAITAAHNIKGIIDVHAPHKRHHPSALSEFLPDGESLQLSKDNVRAICTGREGIEVALIKWTVWDKKTDVAFLSIRAQNTTANVFKCTFELDCTEPQIGDEVAVFGFANMQVLHEFQNKKGYESALLQQQLLLRCGYVKHIYPNGHLLCKGPCIETSIPVFPGMSGGPVVKLGKDGPIKAFGLISSDPDYYDDDKYDFNVAGSAVAALLRASICQDENGGRKKFFNYTKH